MGKRTSQIATPTATPPRVRRKRRSLFGGTVRVLAFAVVIIALLFLAGGWYFSGRIESGALEPPKSEPTVYDWEVTAADQDVSLLAGESTDPAGDRGRTGLWWEDGYVHSLDLVRSETTSSGWLDVRSLDIGEIAPPVGAMVKVDMYNWRGTPDEALGVDFETVSYTSDVGSFPAWFIDGDSSTWAIVFHGKGGTQEEGLRVVPILQELGYPILIVDYRNDVGQPRDPSGYFTYGVTDWRDVAGAVRYAQDHGATDHVLVGYSYAGSMITSFLTQSPLRNFTKAAILDSPLLSLSETVDFRAADTNLPILPIKVPAPMTALAKWISSWRFDIDWEATDYLEQTAELHAPMLVFHGSRDTSVPLATSVELEDRRPDIVTLVTTDAGHTQSWNIDPDAYAEAINQFLDDLD